jgi:hypothetical protein
MFPPSPRPLGIALPVGGALLTKNLDGGERLLSRRDRLIVARDEAIFLMIPGTWRGALGVIYAPKVATGLSPGFQPWEPSK